MSVVYFVVTTFDLFTRAYTTYIACGQTHDVYVYVCMCFSC